MRAAQARIGAASGVFMDHVLDGESLWSLADIARLARHLAQSGRFCGWRLIAIELRFMQGLSDALAIFEDSALREELDALCRAAERRRRRSWPHALPPIPAYRWGFTSAPQTSRHHR